MKEREALKLALEYWENGNGIKLGEILKEALAQPEQEPVAWTLTEELEKGVTTTSAHLWFTDPQNSSWTPLYTTPPQRTWVGLTDEDWDYLNKYCGSTRSAIQTAETLLKEKNT